MKTENVKPSFRAHRGISIVWLFLLFATGIPLLQRTFAQCTFSSGSTGGDGEFNPPYSWPTNAGWSVSNNVITVTNTPDGIFNFTSVTIPNIYTIKFTKNALNTPVYILAQSNVVVDGRIDVSGSDAVDNQQGYGGPGGYDGGPHGSIVGWGHGVGFGSECNSSAGFGRTLSINCATNFYVGGSKAYGTFDLQPMIGGSGGAVAGGGGGGALLIASSGTITVSGTIAANGGCGYGRGSGGAIKLLADTINGEGRILARSGCNGDPNASEGRIRLEACKYLRASLSDPPATFGTPGYVFLSTNPTIRVESIAGLNIAWPPSGLLSNPDANLPSALTNPISISVSASNITLPATFKVIVAPAYGTNMVATNELVGTYAYSTGTVIMDVYTDRVWRVNALIDYIPRPQ